MQTFYWKLKIKFFVFIIFSSLSWNAVYSQCEFFEDYYGIIATIAAGSTVGQSFEMNCANGDNAFKSFTINHQAPHYVNGTLRIFAGETYTGTPQYEQNISIANQGGNVHETIVLGGGTGSLMFVEGEMYTVTFVFSNHFRWNGRNNSHVSPGRALWPNNGGTWVSHFDYFYKVGTQLIITDSDGDGVDDPDDDCPNTPTGEGVNADGCSCSQVTVDDGDPCTLDECTNGIVTNTFQDADGDGVCDANDVCPGGDDNLDNDVDGTPDFCDDDDDNDGINDNCDTAPFVDNYTYNGIGSDFPAQWLCGNNNNKVLICHVPPGNPNNAQTNCVNSNAVQSHLNHGDYLGECTCLGGTNIIVPNNGNHHAASAELELELYPNPAKDVVNIHLHGIEAAGEIMIFDLSGKMIFSQKTDAEAHELNINVGGQEFMNGVYMIKMISEDLSITKRLVIQK